MEGGKKFNKITGHISARVGDRTMVFIDHLSLLVGNFQTR